MADDTDDAQRAAFRKEIAAIMRRYRKLTAAARGEASVRRVWRKGHDVSAHKVSGHYMTIISLPKRKPAMRRKRRA